MSELRTVLVHISGRVQGVWFRDWTKRKASALGIVGWVRNRHDQSVEALFSGPCEGVGEMIEKCRSGPPLSRVDDITVIDQDGCDLQGFEIRQSG